MKIMHKLLLSVMAFALMLAPSVGHVAGGAAAKGESIVYVGTYTGRKSKGIYAFRFNPATGSSTPIGLVAETPNPSFLVVHPNRRFLFAVNEINNFENQSAGSVSAFTIDQKSGRLTFLNRVSTRGGSPCHVAIDRTGKWIAIANYGGGSVAAYPINKDGGLGEASAFVQHTGASVNQQRQKAPHAHSVNFSPDNRFLVVSDLGLDQVLIYSFDATKGTLKPNDPPHAKTKAGAGPRHFAFHPRGGFAYVINEIDSSVTAFRYQSAQGKLDEIQSVSTLPGDFSGNNSTAEVEVHPSGKYLYGSNRGRDSIAVFSIDSAKGVLAQIDQTSTQGKTPRNFAIDPTGAYLFAANQGSDTIVVFKIDQKTGKLTASGNVLEAPTPVCIAFLVIE